MRTNFITNTAECGAELERNEGGESLLVGSTEASAIVGLFPETSYSQSELETPKKYYNSILRVEMQLATHLSKVSGLKTTPHENGGEGYHITDLPFRLNFVNKKLEKKAHM